MGQGHFQAALERIQPLLRLEPGAFFIAIQMDIGDQQQPSVGMVEGHQGVGQQENAFREVGVGFQGHAGLEKSHDVVAQVSNQAAGKTRQAGYRLGVVACDLSAQGIQWIRSRR